MKAKNPASVQSIERGLTLLEELSREKNGLGVSELARRTNLPVSTVHRLLSVFVNRGYLSRENGRGPYRVDAKILGLGLLPTAVFCQLYPLICRHFAEQVERGEVHGVFLQMDAHSFWVRSDHREEKNGAVLVPELTNPVPGLCIETRRDDRPGTCRSLDRNLDDAHFHLDESGDSWCACLPIRGARGWGRQGKIGVGGHRRLRMPAIRRISSNLVDLKEEIVNSIFKEGGKSDGILSGD